MPDVTARRNTIANALELVKVTKGKVGAYLSMSLHFLGLLDLASSLTQNIIVSSQAEKVCAPLAHATRPLCILCQWAVCLPQVFDIRAPEDVVNLYPPQNGLRAHHGC